MASAVGAKDLLGPATRPLGPEEGAEQAMVAEFPAKFAL
jgi:hypothetical protein